jgi:hypothetical protein
VKVRQTRERLFEVAQLEGDPHTLSDFQAALEAHEKALLTAVLTACFAFDGLTPAFVADLCFKVLEKLDE